MARAKQIIYNQGEGVSKIELVEPPQSLLTFLQIPLNFYAIFWFASVIVFTVNFFQKSTYKETVILWPDKNQKRLKDILLPDATLSYLTEWICFLRANQVNQPYSYVPKGILLVGPPGTGKTTLAQAFAYEANLPIICETVSHFYAGSRNVWYKVREIFRLSQKWSPSILFLDDMGTLGSRPSDPMTVTQKGVLTPLMFKNRNESQKTKNGYSLSDLSQKESCHKEMTLLTHFLIELDGLQKRKGVIVMGATHTLEGMDRALLRPGRFERILWLKPLNQRQRISLLQHNFKRVGHTLSEESWQTIGPLTEGLTGASLQSIADKIILQNKGVSKITTLQIQKALKDLQKQISVQKYQKKETKELTNLKGLGLRKWWMDEISTRMANIPTGGWNTFYAHEPLGDWYQQAFVESKNLPKWNQDVAETKYRDPTT
uniref:Cell division protein n=1 Tax=Chloropicon mariensis TaxID=1606511 RepID=A0A4D6C1W6_9CHLO|nr:cell division protein [Chloropicon mariensis]QBX97826.1 cell division protein [Chloropicon mariensis]UQK95261.1 cell division protein [Chloropicon mariensis]